MTDEQCLSIWAKFGHELLTNIFFSKSGSSIPKEVYAGIDSEHFPFFLTAWKPSKEDIEAINRGEPIYIRTVSTGLPPMAVFTMDENGEANY